MKITAVAKHVRISEQKLLTVARAFKNMPPKEVLTKLALIDKKGARLISDVVKSALANARNTNNLTEDVLMLQSIEVSKGPLMKRFRAAAKGAAHKYTKKTSHITVTLIGVNEKNQIKKISTKEKHVKKES